ncbi:MAG TPA: YncE family protein [Thermoleophilia bacterium]
MIALVVVVLAAAGYGGYRLLRTDDEGSASAVGPAASSTVSTVSSGTTGPGATTGTTDNSGTSGTTTAPGSATSTTSPTLAPQKLSLQSNPGAASVDITLSDGTTVTGKTPFSQVIPGGQISLKLSLSGHNPLTRTLELTKARSITVWLDPAGLLYQSVIRFKTGPNPKQVAFSPDGKELWVSDLGGYGVEVFDPGSGKKLAQVKLGAHGAVEVIFTRDGKTVYASQMETASVYEIDRATRTVKRILKTGGTWTKVLALSPDEKTLYAANWVSNNVSEIELATGKLKRLIKTVTTPRGLYVTPDGERLFVAGYDKGDIQRITLATGASKILLHTGGAMRHMVGDDANGLLYADDMLYGQVYVVDLATESVRKLAKTDKEPNTIDLSPDGKVLYVSNRGKNNPKSYYIPGPEWGSVLAIDTATGKILDAIVGGNQCTGLDVSPDGKLLAFSDFLDNRIRVYSIPDYQTLVGGGGGRAISHLKDLAK